MCNAARILYGCQRAANDSGRQGGYRKETDMPYTIRYVKGDARPWKIVKKDTGEVVGSSKTRAAAGASIGHREEGEHPATRYAKARKKAKAK